MSLPTAVSSTDSEKRRVAELMMAVPRRRLRVSYRSLGTLLVLALTVACPTAPPGSVGAPAPCMIDSQCKQGAMQGQCIPYANEPLNGGEPYQCASDQYETCIFETGTNASSGVLVPQCTCVAGQESRCSSDVGTICGGYCEYPPAGPVSCTQDTDCTGGDVCNFPPSACASGQICEDGYCAATCKSTPTDPNGTCVSVVDGSGVQLCIYEDGNECAPGQVCDPDSGYCFFQNSKSNPSCNGAAGGSQCTTNPNQGCLAGAGVCVDLGTVLMAKGSPISCKSQPCSPGGICNSSDNECYGPPSSTSQMCAAGQDYIYGANGANNPLQACVSRIPCSAPTGTTTPTGTCGPPPPPPYTPPSKDAGAPDGETDGPTSDSGACTSSTAGASGGSVKISTNPACTLAPLVTADLTLSRSTCPVYDAPMGLSVGGTASPVLSIEAGVTVAFGAGTGLQVATGTGTNAGGPGGLIV
jgi:hypothetical protein